MVLRGGEPLYIVRKVNCMTIEQTFVKFGFIKDENNVFFNEVFKNNTKLNELYIDVYNENPINHSPSLMLLLRTCGKNISVVNENNRISFKKNDEFNTCIANLMISKIKTFYKKVSDNYVDFILNVCNVWYKITIFI